MMKTFDCPKCGAPVTYERPAEFGASRSTIRCDYCHSQLIAPNEISGQPAQVVRIRVGLSEGAKFPKWILLVLAIPLIGAIVGVLAAFGALVPAFYSISRSVEEPARPVKPNPPKKESKSSFASLLHDFGKEGVGPGMFTDARSIGVDGAGQLYVGEYTGGRVQVFDAEGKFVTQWSIGDRKTLLRGLGVDRKGTIYVVTKGHIERYRGETGEKLGQVEYERNGFDDVAVGADGGLVAAWHGTQDDIFVFDANGKVVRTIPKAISGASGDSELSTRVAVDGAGNIYALGRFNEGVFKFARDGKFMNRFGGKGNQPGQLQAAYSIAVDGFGRVYVGDIKGIQVFDGDGRYLSIIDVKGMPFGMAFNDQNELFVVAGDHVVKYSVAAQ